MLVDELRELTSNSKQYQEEYERIVEKLKEVAENGLNEMKIQVILCLLPFWYAVFINLSTIAPLNVCMLSYNSLFIILHAISQHSLFDICSKRPWLPIIIKSVSLWVNDNTAILGLRIVPSSSLLLLILSPKYDL